MVDADDGSVRIPVREWIIGTLIGIEDDASRALFVRSTLI
jgi:hypothetical protein